MKFSAQKLREVTMQCLFSFDFEGDPDASLLMRELTLPKSSIRQAHEKALLIWENRDAIDQKIGETSQEYALNRIPSVEKNILRLAIYEALYEKIVSVKILISESIRLARKFSTPEAGTFINAILDPIFRMYGTGMDPLESKELQPEMTFDNHFMNYERQLSIPISEG